MKRPNLLSHYDFMPAILDYLELENPLDGQLPGRSFAPVLRGKNLDAVSNETEGPGIVVCDEYGPNRMLRTPEWKYVQRYPGPGRIQTHRLPRFRTAGAPRHGKVRQSVRGLAHLRKSGDKIQ